MKSTICLTISRRCTISETAAVHGPISDVVPSSSVFDMYPIGLTSIAGYLERFGYRVKIVNLAARMVRDRNFDVEAKIRSMQADLIGIDLHWLPHAHGSTEIAKLVKKFHPPRRLSSAGYRRPITTRSCSSGRDRFCRAR